MLPSAGTLDEQMFYPPVQPPELELGVVGWPGEDKVCDIGTEDNDGHTLVRVTLYAGTEAGACPPSGEAAGYRVTVRTTGPLFFVPPKGTEVVVAFPSGFGMAPGNGVLLCTTGPSPGIQFRGNKTKLDMGPEQDVVIKGRSVTISDYENRFITVGPDTGTLMSDKDGTTVHIKDRVISIIVPDSVPNATGDFEAKAVLHMGLDALMLLHDAAAGQSVILMEGGSFKARGQEGILEFGSTNIGKNASPVTAAVVAPVGASGMVGVASGSVFISP